MKILLAVMGIAVPLALIMIGYVCGRSSSIATSSAETLERHGLTQRSPQIYREAMRLLNAMVLVSDLDGPFTGNLLTPETQKEASRLVAAYREDNQIR